MSDEYPLFPKLTEQGEKEAQRIMDSFKPRIQALVTELMDDLYCDVAYHVESDSWTNYRNDLMDGFKGYTAGSSNHPSDFKELRQAIYKNHKEAIVGDLNQDLIDENKKLAEQVEQLQNDANRRY